MPTPRKHANNAARQAAHHARQRAERAALEAAATRLHDALMHSAAAGNAQAELLRAESPTATIERVAAHYEDDAAHRRQPGWVQLARETQSAATRPGRFTRLPELPK